MTDLMPDGFYRPIPSVWFVAGAVAQSVMLAVLYVLLAVSFQVPALVVILAGAVWTVYLIHRIWPRKMAHTRLAWRIAFLAMLGGQMGFFAWGVINGPSCEDVFEYPEAKCKSLEP